VQSARIETSCSHTSWPKCRPACLTSVSKQHACISIQVASIELVHGARIIAEAVQNFVTQFGQLALLAVTPVDDSIALFLLFERQRGDYLIALVSFIRVASEMN